MKLGNYQIAFSKSNRIIHWCYLIDVQDRITTKVKSWLDDKVNDANTKLKVYFGFESHYYELQNNDNMKIIKLLIVSLFTTVQVFSQPVDYVEFDYDAAGNRETREVIYLKTTAIEDTEATNQNVFGQAADSVEFKGNLCRREVSIFPNPTKGSLTIAIAGEQETGPATLALFSISGELVLKQQIRQPNTTLDLSGHPPGNYLLQISTAAGSETWKVVKE